MSESDYSIEFTKELIRKMEKLQKKNKKAFDIIIKKIREIKQNPQHYKPLRYDMKNLRRVHIEKSFVLTYRIDEYNKKIILEDYEHHDRIYKTK